MQSSLTQPGLGQTKVAAPQQKAPVPLRVRPLLRPNGQACVGIPPVDVLLKRCDYPIKPTLGVVARTEEDPIRFQEAGGEVLAGSIPKDHGNDEFVVLNRRLQFASALLGDYRFRSHDEDERLRRFDSAVYPFRPVGGRFNVRPVHPHVLAPRCQRLLEVIDERHIRREAPVGDKGIRTRLPGYRIAASGGGTRLSRWPWSSPIVDCRHRPYPLRRVPKPPARAHPVRLASRSLPPTKSRSNRSQPPRIHALTVTSGHATAVISGNYPRGPGLSRPAEYYSRNSGWVGCPLPDAEVGGRARCTGCWHTSSGSKTAAQRLSSEPSYDRPLALVIPLSWEAAREGQGLIREHKDRSGLQVQVSTSSPRLGALGLIEDIADGLARMAMVNQHLDRRPVGLGWWCRGVAGRLGRRPGPSGRRLRVSCRLPPGGPRHGPGRSGG